MNISRRTFLQSVVCGCAALHFSPLGLNGPAFGDPDIHEAKFYEQLEDGKIHCLMCPNSCVRGEGERGKCRARECRGGKYYSKVYGRPCVLSIDPVEKCPVFHYRFSGTAFSIATAGCNLSCRYCQNWQYSQSSTEETRNYTLTPAEVVEKALEYKAGTIAFFYTEPTIYFEYMQDIAREARKKKLGTVMVTAGYINEKPLTELLPLIDAFTVGLKGFTDEYYSNVVQGTLGPVLDTLKLLKKSGRHLEVVTLLVPTLNDDIGVIRKEIDWFSENLGAEIPLHFTRFNPQYKLRGLPPTPLGILREARKQAMDAGLRYVYIGNVPGDEGNHTFCPKCKKNVIERLGFKVLKNSLVDGKCPECQTLIPGVWG